MLKPSVSAAKQCDVSHTRDQFVVVANEVPASGTRAENSRSAFATRAYARLLDVLGWDVVPSPRRDAETHAPGQFCFVLRNGRHEELAFGYTGLTLPLDLDDAGLRAACRGVERFLARLGEDRGVLFQNTPLLAFAGHRRDRIAIFGGWRFECGHWKPFVLGPEGLGGIAAQDVLFASGTRPCDLAEVCGHRSADVGARLSDLMGALESLDRRDENRRAPVARRRTHARLRMVPIAAGWSTAVIERSPMTTTLVPHGGRGTARRHLAIDNPTNINWESDSDEFRFHQYGADRI